MSMDLLSQGAIALTTWVFLEAHSTSFAVLVASLATIVVIAIVVAAVRRAIVRWMGASWVELVARGAERRQSAPVSVTRDRPSGGRGPRAPGAAPGRLAPR